MVSVVISARNEAERLEGCIASLTAQKSRFPFEVHLVENNSTDGTYALARRLAKKYPKLRLHVWKERRPGSPAARNHGARKALGKVLVFTDADCLFAPGWVENMARPLLKPAAYPLAAVGGVTLGAYRKEGAPNLWERYSDAVFSFWEQDRLADFPAFLPWAPTCNLAVRADVFRALGGFDENWASAAYDVDLCWRLSLSGFVIGHAPKACVHHYRRATLTGLLKQMENYAFFNHFLLEEFRESLGLSGLRTQRERFLSRARRLRGLLSETRSLRALSFRGLDAVTSLASLAGSIEARVVKRPGDSRLAASRRGSLAPALARKLPRGYAHLHAQGWCYWKAPGDVNTDGDLILFRPKRSERYRFNEAAWRIWEVKSERGQSEDAAAALGQDRADPAVLKDIDQLTLELRTRRLLP